MSKQIELGGRATTLEDFNGRRALAALALLRRTAKAYPQLRKDWAQFIAEYEEQNVLEMDRAQALFDFGAERLQDISDEAWQQSGGKLRMVKTPELHEKVAAIFPAAFDQAEAEVTQLLALVTIGNDAYTEARRNGRQEKALAEKGDELLDQTPAEDLLELGVAAAELLIEQFADRVDQLREGGRLGNVAAGLGLSSRKPQVKVAEQEGETPTPDSPPRPTSSTDSESPTGGARSEPSTEPAGVS